MEIMSYSNTMDNNNSNNNKHLALPFAHPQAQAMIVTQQQQPYYSQGSYSATTSTSASNPFDHHPNHQQPPYTAAPPPNTTTYAAPPPAYAAPDTYTAAPAPMASSPTASSSPSFDPFATAPPAPPAPVNPQQQPQQLDQQELDLFGLPIQQPNATVMVGSNSTNQPPVITPSSSNLSNDQEQVYPNRDALLANARETLGNNQDNNNDNNNNNSNATTLASPGRLLGVVEPSNTLPFLTISGFPRERDMASMVLPLPEPARDVICPVHLPPLRTPDKLLKFSVAHDKKKKMFSTHDSFTFFESTIGAQQQQPFYGIRALEEHTKVGRSNRIVVQDANQQPILLCRQKRNLNKKYLIHGRRPLHNDDAANDEEQGVPFYPWFMVRDIDDNHLQHRTVYLWNGRNYAPYLQIRSAKNPSKGQPLGALRIPNKNDLRLTSQDDHNRVYALFSRQWVEQQNGDKVTGWNVCVAPGTDPGLCVALSLVLDDMVGWFA